MQTEINHRRIERAMRQGRVERAIAFRKMALASFQALRKSAQSVVAIFI